MLNFKGVLLGIYNVQDIFKLEYMGIIFWQNHTQTKIKQTNMEGWNISIYKSDFDKFYDHSAIIYNHN